MKKLFIGWLMCMFALAAVAEEAVYVDLGLPSGTLWKVCNEDEAYYTHDEAGVSLADNCLLVNSLRS